MYTNELDLTEIINVEISKAIEEIGMEDTAELTVEVEMMDDLRLKVQICSSPRHVQ